jgi:hypothetical protein
LDALIEAGDGDSSAADDLREAIVDEADAVRDSLRLAATLVCEACRLYATGGAENEDGAIVPTKPPHKVTGSKYLFWHLGLDGHRPAEWPCQAARIWAYLESA